MEKLGCQARSSRIFPLPRVALLCVKTREILNDQGRSLWCSVLAFGERTLRKDEKMDENLILYSGFMSLLV